MKNRMRLTIMAAMLSLGLAIGAEAATNTPFTVTADEMNYNFKSGSGSAVGHVVLIQDGGKATADKAEFNSKNKSAVLMGHVIADKDGAHMQCDKFIAHNEDHMSAIGNASMSKEGKSLRAEQVDYYKERNFAETLGSWAVLTDADGSVLKAAKLDYDMKAGVANATGGVTIDSRARNLKAKADRAVYVSNGYIDLIGNAEAEQDGNVVRGNKLHLTNDNSLAVADGNVDITFIPEENNPKKNAPAKTKTTAMVTDVKESAEKMAPNTSVKEA